MLKFIYIDDDVNPSEKIKWFEDDDFRIEVYRPKDSWELQFDYFSNQGEINGLILDLKLDDIPNEHGKRAKFRGTSIAQEIRTRQKEGIFNSFPIVLFSANENIEKLMENSGRDLFDICIDKNSIEDKDFPEYRRQMVALANGYNRLGTEPIRSLFNVDLSNVDSRFVSEIDSISEQPVHVKARFILDEFISKQGLLVNEEVLAARLGIDREKSNDWNSVLEQLKVARYNGVFAQGWNRWWMSLIEKWWKNAINPDVRVRSISAADRVTLIKEALHLSGLIAANRLDKADSDEFWTVCKALNKPIDTIDGLLIEGQDNLYPWQESEYVSIEAALNRTNIDVWKRLADIEKERYDDLKIFYKPKK